MINNRSLELTDDKIIISQCLCLSITRLTTSASPGSPWLMTSPVSELTLIPMATCGSGQSRPGRAPAPAQTPSRCFFRSQEMRKVTRGLRDRRSSKVHILLKFELGKYISHSTLHIFYLQLQHSPSSPVNLSQCLFRSWEERSIILEYFSR